MAGTVSFKVYMTTENESPNEVRRFGVEPDVVTNFVYLREKLQTIFSSLRGKHFTIYWKDSDNDDVVISSDEELQIALSETASSKVRKLYVILHSEYSSPRDPPSQSNDLGPIHVDITCDGCDKQIQGFRYKCIQCPDYDLCITCEGRGLHPEHCMVRLSAPLLWKPHYGRRLATQVNRFVKKAQSHNAKDEETKQCPHKSGKHHGKSRHHNGDGPSWLDSFATYLDEWANFPGECPMKEMAKEATESSPLKSDAKKPQREQSEKCPAEQIKLLSDVGFAVGETFLSQFLDPLVTVHAKKDVPKPTPAGSASTSANDTPNAEQDNSGMEESNLPQKFPGEGRKLGETVNGEANTDSAAAASAEKIPSEKVAAENDDWTLLNKSDSPTPSVISPISSTTGAIPKQAQASAPAEASPTSIYPNLLEAPIVAPQAPVFHHPNPTIQKSVESMMQMGFTNEGGWLTNLLVSKSGDIAAALDALSPVRR